MDMPSASFDDAALEFLASFVLSPLEFDQLPRPNANVLPRSTPDAARPDASGDRPLASAEGESGFGAISPHAVVIDLSDDAGAGWTELHQRFAGDRSFGNLRPWFRCLGLLRGLKVNSVVIETYYVCLDYKSEHASFYAHLDAPRRGWTVRLHFFTEVIAEHELGALSEDKIASYRGYIVCREGDLPLVGRCMISLPLYLSDARFQPETCAIEERVNLFGQRLPVTGVPFMQQDQRFAQCAHVAAWTISYCAFRRGVGERKLIADIVETGGAIHPLRPRASDGLSDQQVATLLGDLGFRTTTMVTPTPKSDLADLPYVTLAELPFTQAEALRVQFGMTASDPTPDVSPMVTEALKNYAISGEDLRRTDAGGGAEAGAHVQGVEPTGTTDEEAVIDRDDESIKALHRLLDYLVGPYLRSGWPIYCFTGDHALVLCGRAVVDGHPVHFVHDDQSGPYMATESLPTVSHDGFQYQSGWPKSIGSRQKEPLPPLDRVLSAFGEAGTASLTGDDMKYAVHSMIIPVPARVLLPANAANRHARNVAQILHDLANEGAGSGIAKEIRAAFAEPMRTKVSILMGINYKLSRRDAAKSAGDDVGVRAFASLQLAEWVVVVEGLAGMGGAKEDESLWEFVYDASSSETSPRLQFVRFLETMVTTQARQRSVVEASRGSTSLYPLLPIPRRIAKV